MAISRSKAQDYAEAVINRPGGEKPVVLRRHKNGATLLHRGRALTKTHASRVGQVQAELMAEVLGVELPAVGGEIATKVSSGVLYRAIAVSSLDVRRPEARAVVAELMNVAAMQRGAFNTLEIG
jgi:hypothetical protein